MKKEDRRSNSAFWQAASLAWELGYTMALPLVFLALAGRFIDRRFDSSPLFLLIGIFLSIIISSIAIYRKAAAILKNTDQNKK